MASLFITFYQQATMATHAQATAIPAPLPQQTGSQMKIPAELSENKDCLRLTIDLPGVLAKDLDVSLEQGVLTVKGCRRTMSVDGHICLKKQKFQRRYAIATHKVHVAALQAQLAHGVLTIRAPKKVQPTQIPVLTESEEDEVAVIVPNVDDRDPAEDK